MWKYLLQIVDLYRESHPNVHKGEVTNDSFYLLDIGNRAQWSCLSESSYGLNTRHSSHSPPLKLCRTRQMAHNELLQRHKDLICQHLLNKDSNLLQNLVTSGLFRLKEVEKMKTMTDLKTMGDTFVRIVSEKGETGFQHFCSELEKENPQLVSNLLLSSTTGQ